MIEKEVAEVDITKFLWAHEVTKYILPISLSVNAEIRFSSTHLIVNKPYTPSSPGSTALRGKKMNLSTTWNKMERIEKVARAGRNSFLLRFMAIAIRDARFISAASSQVPPYTPMEASQRLCLYTVDRNSFFFSFVGLCYCHKMLCFRS